MCYLYFKFIGNQNFKKHAFKKPDNIYKLQWTLGGCI